MKNSPSLLQQLTWIGIFVQSLAAMLGSLYYSTFGDPISNFAKNELFNTANGLAPCELCWYARILMYPLVVISYVGIARGDKRFTDYVLPFSILGIFLESYHYALQKLPITTFFTCTSTNPCNALQVNYAGFITIPFLCLLAFSFITILAIMNTVINRQAEKAAKVASSVQA